MQSPGGSLPDDILDDYRAERFHAVIPRLESLIEREPENRELRLWLGKSYVQSGRYEAAAAILEALLEQDEQNAAAHLWLGKAYGLLAQQVSTESMWRAFKLARRARVQFESATRLDSCFDSEADEEPILALKRYYDEAHLLVGGNKRKAEALESCINARSCPCNVDI